MQRGLPGMLFVLTTALCATPAVGQDLVVSGGDLVVEDSGSGDVFRLVSSDARAEVGGAGKHGKLSVLDADGNKPLQFRASTGGLDLGFDGVSGELRITNAGGWPTYWISGGGTLRFYDGVSVLDENVLYEFDPSGTSGPVHWGPRTGLTADYHVKSQDDVIIDLEQAGDGSSSAGIFQIRDNGESTVFSVNENGTMVATGSKSAVVETEDHGSVVLYAVESPEVRFEDVGSARLENGATTVTIDPVFAQTVNLEEGYHVSLTVVCDEPALLHVTSKRSDAFTVEGETPDGWMSDCAFDWRLSALRKGFEDRRLEPMREIEERRLAVETGLLPAG